MPFDAIDFQGRESGRRDPSGGANAAWRVIVRSATGGFCLWLGLALLPDDAIVLESTAVSLAVFWSYRWGALRRRSWRIALIEGGLTYAMAVCSCNLLVASRGILSALL